VGNLDCNPGHEVQRNRGIDDGVQFAGDAEHYPEDTRPLLWLPDVELRTANLGFIDAAQCRGSSPAGSQPPERQAPSRAAAKNHRVSMDSYRAEPP
jgi:hypothetical protein